jgi:hypothetical protein
MTRGNYFEDNSGREHWSLMARRYRSESGTRQSIFKSGFRNWVGPNIDGIPPIPPKNAEWMGHTTLQ